MLLWLWFPSNVKLWVACQRLKFTIKAVTLRNQIDELLHATHAFMVLEVIPRIHQLEFARIRKEVEFYSD